MVGKLSFWMMIWNNKKQTKGKETNCRYSHKGMHELPSLLFDTRISKQGSGAPGISHTVDDDETHSSRTRSFLSLKHGSLWTLPSISYLLPFLLVELLLSVVVLETFIQPLATKHLHFKQSFHTRLVKRVSQNHCFLLLEMMKWYFLKQSVGQGGGQPKQRKCVKISRILILLTSHIQASRFKRRKKGITCIHNGVVVIRSLGFGFELAIGHSSCSMNIC